MSRGGICDMLHRWGFTYTRPTYRLKKRILLNNKNFTRAELDKNLFKDMILFYEDETHIRDYQALHTSWFLRGKQKQIPTTVVMQVSRYLVQ